MARSLQEKIANYSPTRATIDLIKKTTILLLVGPSGAGKDALKTRLIKTGKYHHIVSHTTRQPRVNRGILEKDGVEYHFIDNSQAEGMIDNHEFVEVKFYSGHIYGTSVKEIKSAFNENKVAMTDVEVQGVKEYKAIDPNVIAVFLLPPDFNTLLARLNRRYGNTVDAQDYYSRLSTSLHEINELLKTDYYNAVINNHLGEAFIKVEEIVKNKELKCKDRQTIAAAKTLVKDIEKYLLKTK